MANRRASFRLALLILLAGSSTLAAAKEALVGATLIDGTGRAPVADAVVVIDKDRIVAAGPRDRVKIPSDATIRDLTGKWIMPGLMDANVHLMYVVSPDALLKYEGRYEEVITEAAQVALKFGVTTVFDTFGPREALVNVRDRINRGEAVGSRMFVAGAIIGFGGPTSEDFIPTSRQFLSGALADKIDERWEQGVGEDLIWTGPDDVIKRVASYAETSKVDFLKYAASGHAGTQMRFLTFSPEVQKAIVAEGHKRGMTVQAHTSSPESLRQEIEAGADLLQHCDTTGPEPMPAKLVTIMAEKQIPCAAMFATSAYLGWSDKNYPAWLAKTWRTREDNQRKMIEGGVPLLLTTDAGVAFSDPTHPMWGPRMAVVEDITRLGEGHFLWLKAAKELGMTPMDALLAGTRNIARAYKKPDLGTLEPGKKADMLVLYADPLADPENYRRIHLVMKDGKTIDRDALPSPQVVTKP